MKTKTHILPFALMTSLMFGCSSDESVFTAGGGASSGPVTDKNFNMFFSPVDPEVIDDDGFHGGVEVEVVVHAGDKFNTAVNGGTVYIQTEWGFLDSGNCKIVNGSCSVKWTSDADFSFLPADYRLTFTAYMLGEESYVDLNGSGNYDDGDGNTYVRDLEEPFVDISHDGIYTAGTDEVIDINSDGVHTIGDFQFNGEGCTHSTNCSATTRLMIFDIGTINLDQRTPPANTPPLVTISAPIDNDTVTAGTVITFTAIATDTEDGAITGTDAPLAGNDISWSSDLQGAFGTNTSTQSVDTTGWAVGTHTITVRVTDSDTNMNSDEITIDVI